MPGATCLDNPTSWKVAGVSIVGFAHQASPEPRCDDAHEIWTDGEWLVAVASDGAGSAVLGSTGARLLCATLVEQMAARIRESTSDDGDFLLEDLRSRVRDGIHSVRGALAKGAGVVDLADFHATLTGVVASSAGGTFFHIGDGACVAMAADGTNFVVSSPENGEFANETYFFTMPDWAEHLRFVGFGAEQDCIVLMSDGVTPFATIGKHAVPSPGFFDPLTTFLAAHDRAVGEAALAATFERDDVRDITGDDKTLVWALRARHAEAISE